MYMRIDTLKFIYTLAIIKSDKMWVEELKYIEFDKNFGEKFQMDADLWKHNRHQELFAQELQTVMKTMGITEDHILIAIKEYTNKEILDLIEQYNNGFISWMELYNKFMDEMIK